MKQKEAKELLETLKICTNNNVLTNVLDFSDEVLEKLNGNYIYLDMLCRTLILYDNEEDRLAIIDLWSNIQKAGTNIELVNCLGNILINKMLRDNKMSIKCAKIFADNASTGNIKILYSFLTDEYFISHNLIDRFASKFSGTYSCDNIEIILNLIKAKHNDKFIDKYIELLSINAEIGIKARFEIIMSNIFDSLEDITFMCEVINDFPNHEDCKEFIKIVGENKKLLLEPLKNNIAIFKKMSYGQKSFIFRFFRLITNNTLLNVYRNFTKEDVELGIDRICRFYSDDEVFNNELMDSLINYWNDFERCAHYTLKENNNKNYINKLPIINEELLNKILDTIKTYPFLNVKILESVSYYSEKAITEADLNNIISFGKEHASKV